MAGASTACVLRCVSSELAGNENSLSSQQGEKTVNTGDQLQQSRTFRSGRRSVSYRTSGRRVNRLLLSTRLSLSLSPMSSSSLSPSSSSLLDGGRLWKRREASLASFSFSSSSSSSSSASASSSSSSSDSSSSSFSSSTSFSPSGRSVCRLPRLGNDEPLASAAAGALGAAAAASPSAADSILTEDVECVDNNGGAVGDSLVDGGNVTMDKDANDEDEDVSDSSLGYSIDFQGDLFSAANRRRSQGTIAVHAGERGGRPNISDSLTTPLVQTATYTFRNTAELIAFQEGQHRSYEYGRYGNPTTRVLETKISALEGAEDTLVFASGMCAATTMLFALVPKNGHIVTTTDCYRRTRQFIQTFLHKLGITTTVIDPADMSALERALHENQVSLFFSESPTNPYLRCIDVQRVAELCHRNGALVCIDGTFATPINQRSIPLGADIVIHSGTKYLAGHNDVLAGSLSGTAELVGQVRCLHNVLGGVIDPHAAYLILRGLKTLELRVNRQNESAARIARVLESHPKILRVHYPGLESHPEHVIAVRQMDGFGGVVSFEINGDLKRTSQFIDNLKLPYIAPSLGGVESLVEQPTVISYWDQGPAERARLGIKDNLVRYSCGIESCDDILEDILQSLESL